MDNFLIHIFYKSINARWNANSRTTVLVFAVLISYDDNHKITSKAFDSIHRGKMEQILLAYGIPKQTVAAITILYRNTKVKVRSPDGDTEYFDIVAGVLQGDTLAPYLFIICLDYVLRTSIDKIKETSRQIHVPRKQRRINRKGHRNEVNESMDSYQ